MKPLKEAQKKLLIGRLDQAKISARRGIKWQPKPQAVVRAEKVIADYEAAQSKRGKAITDKIELAYRAAEEAVHFAGDEDALKAVRKFEAMKFSAQ